MPSSSNASKIAIVGCGFMGTALLQGWLKEKNGSRFTFAAHVRSPASTDRISKTLGVQAEQITVTAGDDSLVSAVSGADIVLLGVHPGDMDPVLRTPGLINELQGKIIVSMLAGVSTSRIRETLSTVAKENTMDAHDWRVARIIPTLAAVIGESVTLLAVESNSSEQPQHIQTVEDVFSALGAVQHIPERLMDEATAIGAAVHALAITAVESATDASVADGMPRAVALALTAQCLRSCAGLMQPDIMSPEQVKAAMSTPGGITLNSIVKLDESVRSGIAGTVRNAIAYTRSMSG